MTGKELRESLGLDYEKIIEIRASDRESNFDEFINLLLQAETINKRIKEKLDG